ncbi:hypothetical protein IPJ91_00995 [bacterium]|nr:MAG: hypothetical protein IPJ91_00995 [bacterium]
MKRLNLVDTVRFGAYVLHGCEKVILTHADAQIILKSDPSGNGDTFALVEFCGHGKALETLFLGLGGLKLVAAKVPSSNFSSFEEGKALATVSQNENLLKVFGGIGIPISDEATKVLLNFAGQIPIAREAELKEFIAGH